MTKTVVPDYFTLLLKEGPTHISLISFTGSAERFREAIGSMRKGDFFLLRGQGMRYRRYKFLSRMSQNPLWIYVKPAPLKGFRSPPL